MHLLWGEGSNSCSNKYFASTVRTGICKTQRWALQSISELLYNWQLCIQKIVYNWQHFLHGPYTVLHLRKYAAQQHRAEAELMGAPADCLQTTWNTGKVWWAPQPPPESNLAWCGRDTDVRGYTRTPFQVLRSSFFIKPACKISVFENFIPLWNLIKIIPEIHKLLLDKLWRPYFFKKSGSCYSPCPVVYMYKPNMWFLSNFKT